MKHLIRRGLGVALAVVMATGLLSSCGSDYDPVQDIMGYKGSTVLFTVNGQDVTAEQYLFWLAQQADTTYSCASMMQSDDSETSFWDTKVDENSDKTIADQVKAAAQNYAAMYSVVEAKGKEEGYSYTSEDKASYQEDLATAKEQLGGEDAYAKYLKSMCISNKGFEHLSSVSFIHSHMVDGMFQDGKENAPTAEDLTQYAEDNDLLVAKHILLLTKDMTTGEDLSDAEKAEKKALPEGCIGIEDCLPVDDIDSLRRNAQVDPVRLLGMRVLFGDERQSAMVRNGRAIDPSGSQVYGFRGSSPDHGCSCMPAFAESHAPLEEGELVAVVSSNRLSAVYRYDSARRMLVADCVFQVEVSRGADI